MPEAPTHYANLRVTRNAPPEVIRAAYKALMQKHHPDRNPGDPEAERIVKLLNDAYAVLNDPEQRARHDSWIAKQKESRLRAQLEQLGAPGKGAVRPSPTASVVHQRWKIVLGLVLAFALGMGLAAQLVSHARPAPAAVWRR